MLISTAYQTDFIQNKLCFEKVSIAFLILLIVTIHTSFAQNAQYCIALPSFRNHINDILLDTSKQWIEYPKQPKVTDSVLVELEKEMISDDSAKMFLEHLSFKNYKQASDYENALKYFFKKDYWYAILALTVHWSPDCRISALLELKKKLQIRLLENSVFNKNGVWKKQYRISTEFLIHVLESNPLFISGSENATIHSYFISNLIWDLDLITHENIVENKAIRDWYKNDSQFKQAILQWKSHIK